MHEPPICPSITEPTGIAQRKNNSWSAKLLKNCNALYAVKGKEGTLLTMSARNEEKDTLIASGNFRGHTKININVSAALSRTGKRRTLPARTLTFVIQLKLTDFPSADSL